MGLKFFISFLDYASLFVDLASELFVLKTESLSSITGTSNCEYIRLTPIENSHKLKKLLYANNKILYANNQILYANNQILSLLRCSCKQS